MNINNISEGQIFKNYKELCTELGITPSKGNTRIAQYKELERFCNYSKVGHKITIEEIYPKPLPKIDDRGKDSIYGDLVQMLIADLLAQEKGYLSIGRTQLMKSIGMINDNYSDGRDLTKKIAMYIGIDERIVFDFYNTTSSFKKVIERALNNLMDKRVIMYNKVIKVKYKDTFLPTKIANKDELNLIMNIETSILNRLGYPSISEVRKSRHWKVFKVLVDELLHKESDIKYYYTAYDITIHEEYIKKERNSLVKLILEKIKRQESKDELNQLICSNLLVNAKKRHEKAFTSKKMGKVRNSDMYVEHFEKLMELLINPNTEYLIFEIGKIKTLDEELKELECEEDFNPFENLFG